MMNIALTSSINCARHWGLKSLQAAFPDYGFTDTELQTCPVEVRAPEATRSRKRTIRLRGVCRCHKFDIKVLLRKQPDNTWPILVIVGILDDIAFDQGALDRPTEWGVSVPQ